MEENLKKALIVVAKEPVAGRVKTRLCPPLSLETAAELYRCFLVDSFSQYRLLKETKVIVSYFPPGAKNTFKELAPVEFKLLEQKGADLGEKFIHAFEYAFRLGYRLVAIIGSDHPTLPLKYIRRAFRLLEKGDNDLVIGPSFDGGYYLLGLKSFHKRLFQDITWSTNVVFSETIERSKELGLKVVKLPPWYDIDEASDLIYLQNKLSQNGDEHFHMARETKTFLTTQRIFEGVK